MNIETEKETRVRCRTVQERIRLGTRNEGCRGREGNVAEPGIRREPPQKIRRLVAKASYRPRASLGDGASHGRRAIRWEIVTKPSTCSSHDSDSTDHRASNHSTACSADPGS